MSIHVPSLRSQGTAQYTELNAFFRRSYITVHVRWADLKNNIWNALWIQFISNFMCTFNRTVFKKKFHNSVNTRYTLTRKKCLINPEVLYNSETKRINVEKLQYRLYFYWNYFYCLAIQRSFIPEQVLSQWMLRIK